jgi:hypothetical protein
MNATQGDIERIAEVVAAKVVSTLFRDLGIQHEDPFEMQRDFAFLREWRLSCEMVHSRGLIAAITIGMSGIVALLLMGLKQYLR